MTTALSALPPPATCWAAVTRRDSSADFFYAVRSTGIYCRPHCASRRPKRENVTFYSSASAAERAGFRACKRCRPGDVRGTLPNQTPVARALQLLDAAEAAPSLGDLAVAAGVSPFHLQRTFKAELGLSPREYHAARRQQRLRGALRDQASVTNALYAAGYGSSRALYEREAATLGMLPSEYRRGAAGLEISYAAFDTRHGPMLLAATERGVCALRFGNVRGLLAELAKEFPGASLRANAGSLTVQIQAVREHLDGGPDLSELPLDVRATAFQGRVFALLRRIPLGQTRSYSEVAAAIGQPRAVRAVARACASNPVALAIPCHRVVAKDGALAGYRWGMARKQELLAEEAKLANISPAPARPPKRPPAVAQRRR